MLGLGLPELIVIVVLVFVLFGAGKLPEVMRDLGKGAKAFREGMAGDGKDDHDDSRPARRVTVTTRKKPAAKKPVKRKKAA